MKNRNPLAFYSSIVLLLLVVFASCKKINEATELGADLIPTVDNINTFADTLAVETYNELFTELNDSTRISYANQQFLGHISNDPLFGKTTASMFLELKPSSYPFSFGNGTNFQIDSVVLVLSYKETYGDTTVSQKVNVFELDESTTFKADSNYLIRSNTLAYTNFLGSKTFVPRELNDSITLFREKSANQLRIRLDDVFGQNLLNKNGLETYTSDEKFKAFFKGFAIVPDISSGGNAVMGFQLTDTNSKLAIYYNYTNASSSIIDTVSMFRFRTDSSAAANLVTRDYNGAEIKTYLTNAGTEPDPLGFIQNTPGSYVRVKIPELANLNNRVIHRAELIVKQVADPSDALFPASPFLFIDALIQDSDPDPEKDKYRGVPYDFNYTSAGSPDLEALGAVASKTFDISGKSISFWRLNLTRYIQNIVNKREAATDFRLSSPYVARFMMPGLNNALTPVLQQINQTSTKYRVRVAGGNHPEPTQRMGLRIVYSNIQ